MKSSIVTLISPRSVAGWYVALGGATDSLVVIGEDATISVDAVIEELGSGPRPSVQIHSGHDSLRRDQALAVGLRERGYDTRVQSAAAIMAGLDKVIARTRMKAAGICVTPWGLGTTPANSSSLVKDRNSTQSRSIAWSPPDAPLPAETYWEQWIDGVEYSAVGFREAGATTVLPLVEKGPTRRDLLPPWRRMRTVGLESPAAGAEMVSTARHIAELFDVWGFFEVEFVVSDVVQVIELNPRISGTLRLAAMAAELRIFAEGALAGPGRDVPAVLLGIELPFDGQPIVEEHLIASSRITCVGGSFDEIRDRLLMYLPAEKIPVVETGRD